MRTYRPKPIDTSDVILSDDLNILIERIAENIHDVWAQGRINEGWMYGKEKNSQKKTSNCLVPYKELPENEKDYDRNTVAESIKMLIKLGYEIRKNSST